jgi:DNA-binding NarL/FixJ family response regulator
MDKIKVLIVDDQTLMRDGLKTILNLEDNIEVAAMAKDGIEALEVCANTPIDVVLMDIRMPKMNGVQCTKEIKSRYPDISVLILTTFDDDEYITEALSNGASGYILKDIEGDALIKAVADAYNGSFILPSNIAIKLARNITSKNTAVETEKGQAAKDVLSDLSERELEIAKMMAQGFTNKQIASTLYISLGTVKNYVSNIYGKIGTSERPAAVVYLKDAFKL